MAVLGLAACSDEADSRAARGPASTTSVASDSRGLFTTTTSESRAEPCDGDSRHVLLVGIDGLRSDALQAAATPNLDALTEQGTVTYAGFVGGERGGATEQATDSGPGWASILTGVWVDKHHVADNEFTGDNLGEYPHLFVRIREVDPTARLVSIVHWPPLNLFVREADYLTIGDDAKVSARGVEQVSTTDPTVVLLHFDDVDGAGHEVAYGPAVPEYLAQIEEVDGQAGAVLEAIAERPHRADECWMTVVVTDHGGDGANGHGAQTDAERTVPIIVSGDGIPAGEVTDGPGVVVVAPTVLAYLGYPADPAWRWESEPWVVPAR